jgi:hypothetical protein
MVSSLSGAVLIVVMLSLCMHPPK